MSPIGIVTLKHMTFEINHMIQICFIIICVVDPLHYRSSLRTLYKMNISRFVNTVDNKKNIFKILDENSNHRIIFEKKKSISDLKQKNV